MDDKRKDRSDHRGFTLVEVMVSLMILVMVSQVLFVGIRFGMGIRNRAEELESAGRQIGDYLMEQNDCEYGTVRLEMRGHCEDLVTEGWLYTGDDETLSDICSIIWVEEGF